MGTRLFVGGLSFNTDDAGLFAAFEPHGQVLEAKVILDRDTGRSRGFGFVNFAEESSAQAAIQAMNGSFLDGRTIRVNEAQERGGGGGRGRGPGRSSGRGPGRSSGRGPARGGYRDSRGGPPRGGPEVVTRGRPPGGGRGPGPGPGGPRRGPPGPPPPHIPDGPPPPFENEFDDRKRRDFSKKQRKKTEREHDRQPQRPPRKPNRRASGRSWRDYNLEDEDDL